MSDPDQKSQQTTDTVVMVRPARFQRNPQTLSSNAFQARPLDLTPAQEQAAALAEFNDLVTAVTAAVI